MKPKRWQALVMVAFAWVLWGRQTQSIDAIEFSRWLYYGGYNVRKGCIDALSKRIAKIKKENPKGVTLGKPSPTVAHIVSNKTVAMSEPRRRGVRSYLKWKRDPNYHMSDLLHLYCVPSQNVTPRDLELMGGIPKAPESPAPTRSGRR
jgi:hypothetical protein